MRITALAGGTGAAKLLRGLAALVPARDLTTVVNTGDDTDVWGLHVSPDVDTVMYALAGVLDVGRGWGRSDETFRCRDAIGVLGLETWFNIGDRDLATHLVRTRALRSGQRLSEVTADLARRLGIQSRILPMTDDRVRTRIQTPEGWLAFQEYFVRDRARPKVLEIDFVGASRARAAPGVLAAIAEADVVLVCPSNPVTSIGPIVAVPGIWEALCATAAPVLAVSPIVGGDAVSGPAGDLMRARGLPVSPAGVGMAYGPWLSTLLIDESDAARTAEVEALGVRPVLADIMMTDRAREMALARAVLRAGAAIGPADR